MLELFQISVLVLNYDAHHTKFELDSFFVLKQSPRIVRNISFDDQNECEHDVLSY